MLRVPCIDPRRDREIARLKRLLAALERIPAHRREDECADEREADVKALIAYFENKRPRPFNGP
jgi:hypothetical protein